MASPLHRHSRSGSSNMRRPQNTKAAAQRLARVMATQQQADEEEEEDEFLYDFEPSAPSSGLGLAGSRPTRNRSPLPIRKPIDQPTSARTTLGARPSSSSLLTSLEHQQQKQPLSTRSPYSVRQSQSKVSEQPRTSRITESPEESPPARSVRTTPFVRTSQSRSSMVELADPSEEEDEEEELAQSPSARSVRPASVLRPSRSKIAEPIRPVRSSRSMEFSEEVEEEKQAPSSNIVNSSEQQTLHARTRSVAWSSLRVKTALPFVPQSVKTVPSGTPMDGQSGKFKDKRLSLDFGTFKYKEPPEQKSSSALQDELDMLQEENESLLEKLRLAEEKCEEAESRTRQLEKQIASLGEGVSLEARLLSRKEADLQKREAALKLASQTYGGSSEEIAALRVEAEAARGEATSALEQLRDAEIEVTSLRIVTQRMILTKEEMEEVILKRCWLARYWSLCVKHGIHVDIAEARNEYWSSLAPRPVQIIIAAGRKAKDDTSTISNDLEERDDALHDREENSLRVNVESMLLVEKGLRELTSLKVEDAVALSMAQKRRPNVLKLNDELKLPAQEGNNFTEAFELSQEECEDVLLKQAWLLYFWRRAKNHGLEPDISDERLRFWIDQANKTPNSHDAVDVERGLMELRKLGIETKLWEESRRLIDRESAQKTLLEIESQILE